LGLGFYFVNNFNEWPVGFVMLTSGVFLQAEEIGEQIANEQSTHHHDDGDEKVPQLNLLQMNLYLRQLLLYR